MADGDDDYYINYEDEEEDVYMGYEEDEVREEDEYELDVVVETTTPMPYTIFTEEDIHRRQEADIAEISSILALSGAAAAALLCHHDWEVEKAKDAWFGDEKAVREKVGLFDVPVVDDFAIPVTGRARKLVNCRICFNRFSRSKFSSVSCGHLFCLTCWKSYVRIAIDDGPGCLSLRCAAPSCSAIVDRDMINRTVDCEDYKAKYSRYFLRSYIESRKKMKWCPAPDCHNAIEHESAGSSNYDVKCNCTHFFCWNCSEEAHRPVDCGLVEQWVTKNSSEAENTNWIIVNSKPCPKCKRPIEKNAGCMHMSCAAPCRFQFCWICLGSWAEHGRRSTGGDPYACNGYNDSKRRRGRDEEQIKRERLKSALNRYVHYYERWVANHNSRQKALNCLQEMKASKLAELRLKSGQAQDSELNCITDAWEQIVECRRILKWTYVYGYYLPEEEKKKKELFEYLQGHAELSLERLHGCVEKGVKSYLEDDDGDETLADDITDREHFDKFRSELTTYTTVTNRFFENLMRALENNLEDVGSDVY